MTKGLLHILFSIHATNYKHYSTSLVVSLSVCASHKAMCTCIYIALSVLLFINFDIKTEKSLTLVCCNFKTIEKITLMHTVLTCKLFHLVLLKWSKMIIHWLSSKLFKHVVWTPVLFLFFPSFKIKFWNLLTGNKWVSAKIKKKYPRELYFQMSRILAFAKYNVHTLCFGIDLFDDNEYKLIYTCKICSWDGYQRIQFSNH